MNADTVRVRHIGKHAKRADTMSGEGTIWRGEGDIQPVSRRAWTEHLSKFPDLWELVVDTTAGTAGVGLAHQPAAPEEGGTADLAALDRSELLAMADARGLKFDRRAGRATLLEMLAG